jgi:hypothetical protein
LTPALAIAAAPPRPAGPANARAVPGVDLTGQWVAIVTEDWRWRMVTPPRGDLENLPLNAEGRRVAMTWDLAADNAAGAQCKAWGPGGLIRQPTRIRFSWADDNTLKFETDSGQQTRLFKFVAPAPGSTYPALTEAYPPTGPRTLQGESRSQWFGYPQSRGLGFGAEPPTRPALRVVTRNHTGGYLRKNGAPYSENAVITEHFNRLDYPHGEAWLTVTTIVEDPKYLREPMVTSTDFRKETDTAEWSPRPCFTPPPLAAPPASPAGGGSGP